MSATLSRLESLSPERRALVLRKLEERAKKKPAPGSIPRQERTGESNVFELSSSQERLWFLDRLQPGSTIYRLNYALRLEGELRPGLLRQSLETLGERHEPLRTTFAEIDGRACQIVDREAHLELPVVDLGALAEPDRENRGRRLLRAELERPFDLETGPLLRMLLVRTGPEYHLASLSLHHIIADYWSLGVFLRELTACYRALEAGDEPGLPELPIQFADYAVWQRRRLTEEKRRAELDYWRQTLGGKLPVLELPTDHPRPPKSTFRGGRWNFPFSTELSHAVRAAGRREGVTLFVFLLAAFDALLARIAGATDAVVGSAVANRDRGELQGIFGFLLDTQVFRTDLSGEPGFRQILDRTRRAVLGATEHGELPFDEIVRALRPDRDLRRQPIYQVMLVLLNVPTRPVEMPRFRMTPFSLEGQLETIEDVNFYVNDTGEAFGGSVEYNAEIFDPSTVGRMTRHWQNLLAGVVAEPERPIAELDLLGASERHQMLEWNATETPRESVGVERLFAHRAERHPDTVALVAGDAALSYGELARRANRLARRLRELGVRPDDRVGLSAERSFDMVAAVLGVLTAGAAYVPLDPGYPSERLEYMLENSHVEVLVGHAHLLAGLPLGERRALALDGGDPRPGELSAEPLAPLARPENLAYITYTSGSTGRPKGVAMVHRAAANLIAWHLEHLEPARRTLQFASLSFDVSFQEIFSTLASGGCLALISESLRLDLPALADLVAERGLERLFLPVVVAQQLAQELEGREPPPRTLRDVITAGEQLLVTRPMVELFEHLGTTRLHNHYGPSETHLATALTLAGAARSWSSYPSVGRPISNTSIHLLDRRLEPVPAGVLGELWIGGEGLARGYYGRPALTAERFSPDPFAGRPGSRLYRTGDLARYLGGGEIEFSGRADHQVKIHGFRVEPGEIEAVLGRHPAVSETVVIVRRDRPGERRLVAYLSTAELGAPSVGELRRHLGERLPEYMVPAAFVVLDALPLTANRKVDRDALPPPEKVRPELDTPYEAPRNPVESTLAEIWSRVLGIDRAGISDDFFALGGDSILSLQIVVQAKRAGIRFPLKALYDQPTITALAATADTSAFEAGGPIRSGRGEAREATSEGEGEGIEASFPLSPIQQGILFHSLFADADGNYVEHSDVSVPERLDRERLSRAFGLVLEHHPALRAGFVWDREGDPLQEVHRRVEVPIEEFDWRGLDPAEQEARLEDYLIRGGGARGFELDRPPLLRLAIFRLAEDRDRFALSYHHLVMDGWSKVLVLDELEHAYRELREGHEPALEAGGSYRDFVDWQRRRDRREAEKFWRRELEGFSRALRLEIDRGPRAPGAGRGYDRHQRHLSEHATLALQALCQRLRVAPATVVQGILGLLFGRYAQTTDVVFGNVASIRPEEVAGIESTVGLLINTLPLRVEPRRDPPAGAWLRALEERWESTEPHRSMPLVEIQRLAELEAGEHLFDYYMIYEGYLELGQSSWQIRDWAARDTGYPLYLRVRPGERLMVEANYDRARFDTPDIYRLLTHFANLLEGLTRDDERPLGALPTSSAAERHQIAVEWNATAAELPLERDVWAQIETWVERAPEAVAAVCGERALSYGELARRSGALARRLAERGVGPGFLVAIQAERGLDFLLSILAVLRLGGAWVPLDPANPPQRRSRILSECASRLVVADRASAEELRTELGVGDAEIFELSEAAHRAVGEDAPSSAGHPEHLVYAIYTSGSTGVPKGAMVAQRGMVNHLWAKILDLGLDRADAVAQNASQGFDISVWQMLSPLLVGGRMHVYPDAIAHDPRRLLDAVEAERISIFETVPSLLRFLLDEVDRRAESAPRLGALRWLIPTGEALPPELARSWFERYPAIPMINAFGPTECSDDVTHLRLAGPPPAGTVRISIGRPVVNLSIYALDADFEPLPLGLTGELYVGGVGVGLGYLGDPRRTADVFVPDPFAGHPGARLYATGDLGRFRRDGNLDFLGRRDHQVKIRGLRLELGEIEAILAEHPAVREVAVLVRRDGGEPRLAAFLAASGDEVPGTEALRGHLAERLPESALPSHWAWLDALPQTPNGKIDRKALARKPLAEAADPPGAGDGGRLGPTEEIVSAIWARLLEVGRVGRGDNFFELGGHSLLATQINSRIGEAFGVELPLRTLFEAPTLESFAARVDESARAERGLSAPPIEARGASEAPLSFAQQRLWFLDRLVPESPLYNIPTALRLEGRLSHPALEAAVTEIVHRHEILRTRFRSEAGRPVQVIEAPRRQAVPTVDLGRLARRERERELHRVLRFETQRPFDLGRGGLLRLLVVALAEDDRALAVTLHHIASDGWSTRIFVPEMAALYRAALGGEPSPLEALEIQYADFAQWQREWLQGEVLAAEIDYWRGELEGAPDLLELPADRPRPAMPSFRGGTAWVALPAELQPRVGELARREGVTRFMLLLAAFETLLHRLAGERDLVVGTPVAGRTRVEIERLIGFFVNTLALYTRVEPGMDFRTLLARVRETALGAYSHQDVPFERLVEELAPERNLARTPFFQVMFVLQDVGGREPIELPELVLKPLGAELETAKFDLSLSIVEARGSWLARAEYSADLFDETTVRRWLGHFARLLETAVGAPETRVRDLPWLAPAERHQVLRAWNDSQTRYPDDRPLAELAHLAARPRPDAVAVVYGEHHLSRRELHRRVDRLAEHLRRLGVTTDQGVGLCLGPSPELVIGVLGILTAGGTYVPLDPEYPQERLSFMLEDTGIDLVLTHEAWAERWSRGSLQAVAIETVTAAETAVAETSADLGTAGGGSQQLAYVIYTSGSTGRPKGIGIPQRAVARLVLGTEYVELGPDDAIAQVSNTSFDASTFEFWGALLTGARLVGVPRDVALDPRRFAAALAERRISAMFLTTSLFNEVIRRLPAAFSPLSHLLVGGEALDPRWIAEALAGRPPRRLLNVYGPTESTTFATSQLLRSVSPETSSLPIGRPIANSRAHVADPHLRPRPIGVSGELLLGGDGLARGYLDRPRLTARAFVPDPFAEQPGARLYRTGDLVRHLADGALEYLGRLDHQVKVRGHRIELGEIETALRAHPGVAQAAALVREDTPGQKRLVAYWARAEDETTRAEELRTHLGARLPGYMLPEVFVELDELPLDPNGKIDRKALPAPESRRTEMAAAFVEPSSELERRIAGIWCEVLDLDQVGAADNFFDLGGHSLLIVQVHERLRSALEREIPIVDLFNHPTVRSLAKALAGSETEPAAPREGLERAEQRRGLDERRRERRQRRRAAQKTR